MSFTCNPIKIVTHKTATNLQKIEIEYDHEIQSRVKAKAKERRLVCKENKDVYL